MGKYCEKFKKGYLDMLLLQLLSEGDLYGYEMAQLFNTLSDNIITLTAGNMYPALYRLEDKGFISKRKELVGRRMEVVYYHLTELGEAELQEMRYAKKKVTGRIVDENDEPLIGASVISKGSTQGTITNIDGEYTCLLYTSETVPCFQDLRFRGGTCVYLA